jgi:ABC-type multidrug transport system permease subunit
MQDEAKWHWGEGFKYAIEAMKTLFIINGAGAVSILTFIGNTKAHFGVLIISMVCFAAGASMSALTQCCAYVTQLQYGNASQQSPSDPAHQHHWGSAALFHNLTYGFAAAGFVLFFVGICFAALGLYSFGAN